MAEGKNSYTAAAGTAGASAQGTAAKGAAHDLTLTRICGAPRRLVFMVGSARLHQSRLRNGCASAQERERIVKEFAAIEGGKQTLERLAEHLSSDAARR